MVGNLNVLRLDEARKGPPVSDKNMGHHVWVSVAIAVIGIIASSLASTLIAGMYVGSLKTNVENLLKVQEEDRAEFKHQISSLNASVNSMSVNLASVSTGLKGLSDALTLERQDRLNNDLRRMGAR